MLRDSQKQIAVTSFAGKTNDDSVSSAAWVTEFSIFTRYFFHLVMRADNECFGWGVFTLPTEYRYLVMM
jgi:hypothetical protein